MIRAATADDIPALIGMGERFFAASGYSDIARFDPASFDRTIRGLMANQDGIVLVVSKPYAVGMAGALVYPFYFDAGHKTAQELFWWVDEEHRGIGAKLFLALRNEVKKRGAASLSMIALDALQPERVGTFYKRHGFRPSERSFIGKL